MSKVIDLRSHEFRKHTDYGASLYHVKGARYVEIYPIRIAA